MFALSPRIQQVVARPFSSRLTAVLDLVLLVLNVLLSHLHQGLHERFLACSLAGEMVIGVVPTVGDVGHGGVGAERGGCTAT